MPEAAHKRIFADREKRLPSEYISKMATGRVQVRHEQEWRDQHGSECNVHVHHDVGAITRRARSHVSY